MRHRYTEEERRMIDYMNKHFDGAQYDETLPLFDEEEEAVGEEAPAKSSEKNQ